MVQLDGMHSLSRGLTEEDTVIAILPFFHIYGLLVIMNWALSNGARIVVMSRFELETFLGALQDYGVTYLHLVPPILLALAKHPVVDQYDLSSLDAINSGAAPLGEGLASAVEERLDCIVGQGYGLTETSPVTHHGPNQIRGQCPHASIGPSLPIRVQCWGLENAVKCGSEGHR
jgi:acyl-CoA synthetase (AMP-forming)/AMP-acid ligase II